MRVLIVGGGGQVAGALLATAPPSYELVVQSRADLDITDEAAVGAAVHGKGYGWIVNAAAYTAVDLAETHRDLAREVNETAVGILARAATRVSARLVHLSTDFVFDGKANLAYLPTDVPKPLSVYGASKLAGEHHVVGGDGLTPGGIVLRTSWVYASTGKNFVLTMLRLMREKPQLAVVCDQIGTPTWATSIGRAIWGLIDADAAPGIYHWTDLGVASWYDFAVAIQDEACELGLLNSRVPVTPISSSQYPTRATRPAFSVLDTAATRAAIKAPADHWRHNLRKMLNELRAP